MRSYSPALSGMAMAGLHRWPERGLALLMEHPAILAAALAGGIGVSLAAAWLLGAWKRLRQELAALRAADECNSLALEELETIIDAVPGGICVAHDAGCKLITGSRLAHELLGVPLDENISATSRQDQTPATARFRMLRDGKELPPEELPMQVVGRTGTAVRNAELEVVRRDGSRRFVLLNAAPLRWADGAIRGVVAVLTDITERRRAEEELVAARRSAERAREAAEEASRAKDQFLAMLSHELRTPLTPVVAAVSMLQKAHRDAETRDALEMIRRNVEMEARLIDDLLDVTRIVRGKVELDYRVAALGDVIRCAVEVCKPDMDVRDLHLGVDLGPCAGALIRADAARLQQVFWNLLKNAIKFTPPGGYIDIRCHLAGQTVVTEVSDSGEGIETHLLPRIFNPFEQGGTRITRQFGGLGLGLTITKGIVELHGGTIEAYSDGKGKGATFAVRLPLVTSHSSVVIGQTSTGGSARPMTSDKGPMTHLRILLVEDHGDTARMMRQLLTLHGHEVQTAGDVATALKLAESLPFDLLLSDLGLPDGNGMDLVRSLRQRGHRVPAIALSGYGREEDIRRSKEAGFAAHLTKPTNPDRLEEAIEMATEC